MGHGARVGRTSSWAPILDIVDSEYRIRQGTNSSISMLIQQFSGTLGRSKDLRLGVRGGADTCAPQPQAMAYVEGVAWHAAPWFRGSDSHPGKFFWIFSRCFGCNDIETLASEVLVRRVLALKTLLDRLKMETRGAAEAELSAQQIVNEAVALLPSAPSVGLVKGQVTRELEINAIAATTKRLVDRAGRDDVAALQQWKAHLQSLGKNVDTIASVIALYTAHERQPRAVPPPYVVDQWSAQLTSIYESASITEADEEKRRSVVRQLQEGLRRDPAAPRWSQCEVLLVGSSLSKFGTNTADLDLCVRRHFLNSGSSGLQEMDAEFEMRDCVFRRREVEEDADTGEDTIHAKANDPVMLQKMLTESLRYEFIAYHEWMQTHPADVLHHSRLGTRFAHVQALVAALRCFLQPHPVRVYHTGPTRPRSATQPAPNERELKKRRQQRDWDTHYVSNMVRRLGWNVGEVIVRARIPVIKATHPDVPFQCDLCLETYDAYLNTQLLRAYAEFDGRARVLGIAVKHWAQRRGINDSSKGFLSSYSFILLTIFFLQAKAKVLPNLQLPELRCQANVVPILLNGVDVSFCTDLDQARAFHLAQHPESASEDSAGELLLAFFQFYVEEFDFSELVVSVRQPEEAPRKLVCWDSENKVPAWRLSIQDPIDVKRDVSSGLKFQVQVGLWKEMARALSLLRQGQSFDASVCESPQPKKTKNHTNRNARFLRS